MIVFLVEYKNCNSKFRRKFLEECFSYAIHDYLENNPQVKDKTFQRISQEIFLIEKTTTARKFLEDIIHKNNWKLIRKINPYLLPFYYKS